MLTIYHRTTVGSTMDECRRLFAAGATELTAVVADAQTEGRGRVGRAWFSPPNGAIYLSVLLMPRIAPRRANQLTMLGALCVLDAISPHLAHVKTVGIKWPNDVQIDGRKIAGVLAESSLLGDELEYSVLGIGLNVAVDFAEAPAEVRARACSLSEFAAEPLGRDVVLDRLLASIERRYSAFAMQSESLLAEYRARLLTIGQDVTVGEVHGRALRVEDDGALVVRTSDGVSLVRFGDITGS